MTVRVRLLAGDAGSSAGGLFPPPRLLQPSPDVSSRSTSAHVTAPSAPPPRACANRTSSAGQGNNGPACTDPRGVGYIVGGMLCVLAGVIISISIVLHFYRRNPRRAARVSQGPMPGQGEGQDGRPVITAPPIAVQSLDSEGSKKGGQLEASAYTTSVCVRLPGKETGLFIAWPEQQLTGSKLSVVDSEEGQGQGQAGLTDGDSSVASSFRESLASGRFWLSDFIKSRRSQATVADKEEGLNPAPPEIEGGPSPDSTVHSSYEAALAISVVSCSPATLCSLSRGGSTQSLSQGSGTTPHQQEQSPQQEPQAELSQQQQQQQREGAPPVQRTHQ